MLITKKGPFIKDDNSTNKIAKNLLIALLPIILFSFYKNGFIPYQNNDTNILGLFRPLINIITPSLIGLIIEIIFALTFKHKKGKELFSYLNTSFSIFPGLFLGLILPLNTSILVIILGSIFATIVGKLVYGGFGKNIFNPALVGWVFVMTFTLIMSKNINYLNPTEMDTIASATPLSNSVISYNDMVSSYGSLLDFFIGTIPGALGETSALLCIIGFIYLVFKKALKWVIPIIYVLTVFTITLIVSLVNGIGIWYPFFQILSGGLLFGAIFMATDPVTSPVTKFGQIIYAISLGILTVIIRYLSPFKEGVAISILIMNLLVFILDKIGVKAKYDKKYKIIPTLIITLLMITLTIIISTKAKPTKAFNILSKKTNNNETTYIVTQKGYAGEIKAEIILTNNSVVKYTILSQNESFYDVINNNDYINTLVKNQYSLKDVDTVTGATISSNALKNMLINTINDYTNNEGFIYKPVEKPKDFEIISKEELKNTITYIVTQKSFGGKLKLEVVLTNNEITSIEVLEQKDSYFDKIEDSKYLDLLIKNQSNLDELDTVTGATISSNALKKAIINIIKEVENDN